ncbi:MAG: DNA recombination protein RmuC [Bacteroidales bacterium]|nr:DNA recombination protein RmuC [Bacteroidales bacterium]
MADSKRDMRVNATEELEYTRKRLDDALREISELTMRLDRMAQERQALAAAEFRNMAEDLLKDQSDSLRDANTQQLNAMLDPLRNQIAEFRKAVNDSYVNENASRRSLADQIERLMQLNVSIGEEARSLSSALKGDSKVQGDWGEMVLETLLESAGMKRDIHYLVQAASDDSGIAFRDTDTGKGLRPDVLVKLPENRILIIDSKVSLSAYIDWHKAPDKETKASAARRHLLSVRRHIDELAAKKYQNISAKSADQVLMFIPNEGAWSLAFSLDDNLWKYAFERKVTVISPAHLFSVMQLVSQMWRQENQNRNAQEIARLGGLLYDRFVKFTSDFSAIEQSLQRAHKAYEECRRDLASGSQSLVARAERLRELGARTSRTLSSDLLSSAGEES